MLNPQKLIFLVLILAVVWFGIKAIGRIKASNEAKAKEGDNKE